jgi:hypothetical protein
MESLHARHWSHCPDRARDYRAGRGHATPWFDDVQIIAWQYSTGFLGNASFVPEVDTPNTLENNSLEVVC